MAKPQVSFSSKSPVRFTPIMLAAPPALNWLESPPPLGFWASTTRASRKHTTSIRTRMAVYMSSSEAKKANYAGVAIKYFVKCSTKVDKVKGKKSLPRTEDA
jgi:hypothetical protein